MATQLRPGVGTALFTRVGADGVRRGRLALGPIAQAIERQAKINLSYAPHRYGTPTPAVTGAGPGLISGALRRSFTHEPIVRVGMGWQTKVGTASGIYPSYRGRPGKTSTAEYGYILEVVGTRAGTKFPFLEPAFRFAVEFVAPVVYKQAYGAGWSRLA